jgi:hypothetical protein
MSEPHIPTAGHDGDKEAMRAAHFSKQASARLWTEPGPAGLTTP